MGINISTNNIKECICAKRPTPCLSRPRVIIFGASKGGISALRPLSDELSVEVIAWSDNDPQKIGTTIEGLTVLSPEDILEYRPDLVIIASMHVEHIEHQLKTSIGIPDENIAYTPHAFMILVMALFAKGKEDTLCSQAHRVMGLPFRSANLLIDAVKATRAGHTSFALACWDKWSIAFPAPYPASIFRHYTDACIKQRQFARARTVLHQGLELYPKDDTLLKHVHRLYILGFYDKEEAYKASLRRLWKLCPDEEVSEIGNAIARDLSGPDIKYDYTYLGYLGGSANYGFFLHHPSARKRKSYITKIALPSLAEIEIEIVKRLVPAYPSLRKNVPALASHIRSRSGNLSFITMEYIHGRKATRKDINCVLALHHKLRQVSYVSAAQSTYVLPRWQFDTCPSTHWGLSRLFSRLHQRESHEAILHLLTKAYLSMNAPRYVANSIDKLSRTVLQNQWYKQIIPSKTYGLAHGDFKSDNILIKVNGTPTIIDWSHFTLAPRGFDLACLFKSLNLTWHEVSQYMDYHEVFATFSPMDRILFLYALIVFWLTFLPDYHVSGTYKAPATFSADLDAALNKIESLWRG